MSLELAPDIESTVREYAAAEGVSINDLMARYFPPRTAKPDTHSRLQALLSQRQKEYGLPVLPGSHKSLAELSADWQAEDANMTEAEQQGEREFWLQRERERDNRPLQI